MAYDNHFVLCSINFNIFRAKLVLKIYEDPVNSMGRSFKNLISTES